MKRTRKHPYFINGLAELIVLQTLEREELYGYQLLKKINEDSQNNLHFEEGAIYPLLHSLERDGYIRSRTEKVKGRKRYYYSLTRKGKTRLKKLRGEWERVSLGVKLCLQQG